MLATQQDAAAQADIPFSQGDRMQVLMTGAIAVDRSLLALAAIPDPPAIVENADINRLAA